MRRRAAALMVVLAVLVLTTTGLTALTFHVTAIAVTAHDDAAVSVADDLVLAAERVVARWLRERADLMVLPPDARQPMCLIMDDRFSLGDATCRVSVVAWDQYGMAPTKLLARGSTMRIAIEPELLAAVDANPDAGGLDELPASGRPVYPAPKGAIALGAVAATHNPAKDGRPRLNVNTAPMSLLGTVLTADSEADVIEARHQGRSAFVMQAGPGEDDQAPQLVTVSDSWAIRIDASYGAVHRSWWTVWTRGSDGWTLRQRILIRV